MSDQGQKKFERIRKFTDSFVVGSMLCILFLFVACGETDTIDPLYLPEQADFKPIELLHWVEISDQTIEANSLSKKINRFEKSTLMVGPLLMELFNLPLDVSLWMLPPFKTSFDYFPDEIQLDHDSKKLFEFVEDLHLVRGYVQVAELDSMLSKEKFNDYVETASSRWLKDEAFVGPQPNTNNKLESHPSKERQNSFCESGISLFCFSDEPINFVNEIRSHLEFKGEKETIKTPLAYAHWNSDFDRSSQVLTIHSYQANIIKNFRKYGLPHIKLLFTGDPPQKKFTIRGKFLVRAKLKITPELFSGSANDESR